MGIGAVEKEEGRLEPKLAFSICSFHTPCTFPFPRLPSPASTDHSSIHASKPSTATSIAVSSVLLVRLILLLSPYYPEHTMLLSHV